MPSFTNTPVPRNPQERSAAWREVREQESYAWYRDHASRARRLHWTSEVLVLLAGALVPLSTIVTEASIAPASLGAVVVVLTGLRTLFNWHDNWLRFTSACTELRTEEVKLRHRLAPYAGDDARALLALRVREIEAAETQGWMVLRRQSNGLHES